jgi:hypothetical protein
MATDLLEFLAQAPPEVILSSFQPNKVVQQFANIIAASGG